MTKKIHKFFHRALIVTAIALLVSSCSVLSKKSSGVSGDSGTTEKSETPTVAASPTTSTQKRPSSTKKQPSTTTKTPSSTKKNSSLMGQLNGEWIIVQAGKYSINQDEDMPYIYFDENDNKFYASNGCNILNGEFMINEQSELTFSNILSTMAICPDLDYPSSINNVIKEGSSHKVKLEKDEKGTIAYLTNSSGKKLLTMVKHNDELLNGEWEVVQIGNKKIGNQDRPNIFLDIPEKTVHGNTGCNYFNGVLHLDPNSPNSISFSQMAVTMRACPNQEVERLMLVALEEAYSYSLSGNSLKLLDSSKKTVITLRRPK